MLWWWPGRRWVLKSPFHLWNLPALLEIFPDALLVQIHREPAECMASFCALLAAAFGAVATRVDVKEVGSIAGPFMRGAVTRCADARKGLPEGRFVDIRYPELLANPIRIVRDIYARARLVLEPETEERMRSWLSGAGAPPSVPAVRLPLSAYGLSEDAVAHDFSPYESFSR